MLWTTWPAAPALRWTARCAGGAGGLSPRYRVDGDVQARLGISCRVVSTAVPGCHFNLSLWPAAQLLLTASNACTSRPAPAGHLNQAGCSAAGREEEAV